MPTKERRPTPRMTGKRDRAAQEEWRCKAVALLGEGLSQSEVARQVGVNAAENALRIRKNSLFFGSEDGGHRAAIALTVLHSCRLARIEPLTYLRTVTPDLLVGRMGRRLSVESLMPMCVAGGAK